VTEATPDWRLASATSASSSLLKTSCGWSYRAAAVGRAARQTAHSQPDGRKQGQGDSSAGARPEPLLHGLLDQSSLPRTKCDLTRAYRPLGISTEDHRRRLM
jgi:hypothetical protein